MRNELVNDSQIDPATLLLRELHHRMFNSYQAILVLAEHCGRPGSAEVQRSLLDELKRRIAAFAALHRMLTKPVREGEIGAFFRESCHHLVVAFGRRDTIRIMADEIALSQEQSCRIPLLITELVTNALKHSPEGIGPSTICVRIARAERHIEIAVWDDCHLPVTDPAPLPGRVVQALAVSMAGQAFVEDRDGYCACVQLPRADLRVEPAVRVASRGAR